MEPKEIADLFLKATDKIEFYWNFYVVLLTAMIGWFISLNKLLSTKMKLLITSGYLVFAVMNVIGLYGAYSFAEALRIDILTLNTIENIPNTLMLLKEHSYLNQLSAVKWIHLVIGVGMIFTIWSGRIGAMVATGKQTPK